MKKLHTLLISGAIAALLCAGALLFFIGMHSDEGIDIKNIPPNATALEDIRGHLKSILAWSEHYKVSPKAIMGIILAERSLHTGPINFFEEYYVKNTFLDKSDSYLTNLAAATRAKKDEIKLRGESENDFKFRLQHGLIWTIGLCQISIIKGMDIDSAISSEECHSPKTVKQNIESLLIPDSNIKYCAYELSTIQGRFRTVTSLDISQDIGVLTTLYNTGKVAGSIDRYNQSHKSPSPNRFGKFVELQVPLLDSLLHSGLPN
jgi:hypothetical protein